MKKKYIIPASSSIALSAESALLDTSVQFGDDDTTVESNMVEGGAALTNRQGIGGGLWENCKK
jgi:hypothetical protein